MYYCHYGDNSESINKFANCDKLHYNNRYNLWEF